MFLGVCSFDEVSSCWRWLIVAVVVDEGGNEPRGIKMGGGEEPEEVDGGEKLVRASVTPPLVSFVEREKF